MIIINVIKSSMMNWAGHMACMVEKRNAQGEALRKETTWKA
jgi:hypothetical protein